MGVSDLNLTSCLDLFSPVTCRLREYWFFTATGTWRRSKDANFHTKRWSSRGSSGNLVKDFEPLLEENMMLLSEILLMGIDDVLDLRNGKDGRCL